MDPERQPLLLRAQHRCGPLSYAEVEDSRRSAGWRRARTAALLLLWALTVTCLALAANTLATASCAPPRAPLGPAPSVPPALVSLAPLMASVRDNHQKQYIL